MPRLVCIFFLLAAFASVAPAQEMEPRAYSRAPVGSQFIVFSYAYQTGDILTDAALPLRDVKPHHALGGDITTIAFGWQYAWVE